MAHSGGPLSLTLCLLTLACALSATHAAIEVLEEGQQVGRYPTFPYCRCNRGASAYSLAPVVTAYGNGTYCFTLQVRNCTAACCKVNLRKIEFDVKPQCAVRSATVRAAINGVPTRVAPAFYRPADGPLGATVLRLTDLPLGLNDNGAQVCITLKAGTNGTGCASLQALCAPPTGAPAGVCNAALFNSNNSTGSCCPQSNTSVPLPPAPKPPAPPATPPPPPPCQLCLTVRLLPPLLDFPPFRLDAALCAAVQNSLASRLNTVLAGAVAAGTISNLLLSYSADPAGCSPLDATICGTFASTADAAAVQALLQATTDLFVAQVAASVCPSTAGGYAIRLFSQPGACITIESGVDCDRPPNPFPFCKCNKTAGITPLFVLPAATVQPGRTPATTLYCFTVSSVPEQFIVPSNCSSGLYKAEIWADDNRRRNVTGIRVTPAGGSPSWRSITWGAKGENSLRVTPLGWTFDQANGGEVCVELASSVALGDVCLGDGGCFISLFDDSRSCCPVYASSPTRVAIP